MICSIYPSSKKFSPRRPYTLEIGEIEDYDFTPPAEQIFHILNVLHSCNLIHNMPYHSHYDVKITIERLINDIDFDSDEFQVSELQYIRIEFRDDLLSLEVYVGV